MNQEDNLLDEINSILSQPPVTQDAPPPNQALQPQNPLGGQENALSRYFQQGANAEDDDFFASLGASNTSTLPATEAAPPPPTTTSSGPECFDTNIGGLQVEFDMACPPDDVDSISGTSSRTHSQSSSYLTSDTITNSTSASTGRQATYNSGATSSPHAPRRPQSNQTRVRFLDDVMLTPREDIRDAQQNISEVTTQRCEDAWLASESTRQLLMALRARKITSQAIDAHFLCRPGVLHVPQSAAPTPVASGVPLAPGSLAGPPSSGSNLVMPPIVTAGVPAPQALSLGTPNVMDPNSVSGLAVSPQSGMATTPGFGMSGGALSATVAACDPIKALLMRYCGAAGEFPASALSRHTLTANEVTQDEKGLHCLIKSGWYRSAIDMTARLLTSFGQGYGKAGQSSRHMPKSIWLWYTRFSLMAQTKQWSALESEMAAFHKLDTPDLYYEFYLDKYPNMEGSLIPFGMRLLHAELPAHLGRVSECLERLYQMQAVIRKMLQNLSKGLSEDGTKTYPKDAVEMSTSLWRQRERLVFHSIVNALVTGRDYISALDLLHQHIDTEDEDLESRTMYRAELYSLLGRIYLQLGDLETGRSVFSQALSLWAVQYPVDSAAYRFRKCFQEALLFVGRGNYKEARELFATCLQLEPRSVLAVNNVSVCSLYVGQLREAIQCLEEVFLSQQEAPHDLLVFNLCTLYELESARATQKKVKVLERVATFPGDTIHVASLKLPFNVA